MSDLEIMLSGWGRYPVVKNTVVRPEKLEGLRALVAASSASSLIARGAGRSYGDAALNGTGRTILTERLNRMLAFDEESGVLRCEAGVTLDEILTTFVPRGWFLPVTPGTRYVTVGGAVAFDVHGKNHHCDGSFSTFVHAFDLLTASGETITCSRHEQPDVFWATIGGAGLTGIITEVTFALRPIETAFVNLHTIKARHLDEALALFDEHDPAYPYSVAWIDCLASGRSLGRSLLTFATHARQADLKTPRAADPLQYHPKPWFSLPFDLPNGVLNRLTIKAFNQLYYSRQWGRERRALRAIDAFFFPLDAIRHWNRMYGKRGFVQYQCVFPPDASRDALVTMLTRLSQDGWGSFLAVLKRFGPASEAMLSFPMPGYTLALDMPMRDGLDAALQALNRLVRDWGGQVYLAKDAHLTPEDFQAMYPRYPEWLAVKSRIDPTGVFASTLSERLQIHPLS